jgi:autotransporter-associated beta strand protein
MYLARCNSQLGEQTASANNWQRALEAAQGDARKLITLAQYAEQNKEAEIAEAAYNGAAAAAPKLRVALASMVIGSMGGGSDLNRMRSQGSGTTRGSGGPSIPDAANNIWGGAIPGAGSAGSGTVASTSGWSMLNLSQQTGGTLALIDGTFLNDATAATKTITAGNDTGSGTNSGAAGNDASSGINSGAAGAGAGQVSGNGTGSSGTTLTGERNTPTIPGGALTLAPLISATWIGDTNSDWGNSSNWQPQVVPGSGDTASFNVPDTANTTINLGAGGRTINTILFGTSESGHFTIGSGGIGNQDLTLNDGGAITVNSPVINDKLINANVILGTDRSTSSIITFTNDSTTASLTIAGDVTGSRAGLRASRGTKILALEGGNALISGDIGQNGNSAAMIALTKDGIGTWTLSGNNLYSGGTIVNGGTLLVNNTPGSGTGSGDVIVNNALSTLGGTGTIGGAVTVTAGANLAPGNGGHTTAIFTVGALTLLPTSNFRIDINGTTAGTGYDQLQVSGAGGPGGAIITLSNLLVHVGTTLTVGDQFTIAHHGGGFQGVFAQGGTVTADNGDVFSVSYSGAGGNDIILTLAEAPVPEPSTWIGGALAIAGLAFTQRRKLRKLIAFSR